MALKVLSIESLRMNKIITVKFGTVTSIVELPEFKLFFITTSGLFILKMKIEKTKLHSVF